MVMTSEQRVEASEIAGKGRSPWADARRRFFRNKAALMGLVILGFVVVFALFGNSFAQWSNEELDYNVMGQIVELGGPSIESGHYFGTDDLGRDLFARTVQGTQISLAVGLVGALIACVVGTLYGAVAGYFGGRTDSIMMRLVDIFMAVPYMFVLILLLVMYGRSITILFAGVGLISWMEMARIVRGQTLTIKGREFVEAARATGVSAPVIILRHIVPNLLGVIAVYATLLVPLMILTESFISFLGLGIQEPLTSLGALISEGAGTIAYGTTWQLGFPLLFFCLTLFGLFFIGDGLRDALDPKDR
ncbi:MAG: ABC transporter permease subunit [Sulfitobacter sp.]|jgi:oligopeptide transport system permease protein|uniref:Oligopeptide transport system permease protein OppC n=1 Tax=Sulfitobacter profundi TaxID=2679961 RepID=A0ABW1Z2F4_9RHOB|nr:MULTISPECIES: ABC transporter permease subunit [Sulfitobacter]AYE87917.1 peptide ABC transporter permease [Sulfitobacter sp. D7]UWR39323.1 ABC transporter permease subunit [Sulfitobacter sp. W074]WOI13822.1 ABC transporter permease subunit [Sulfitobacter sp. LC.270.F.C4]HIF78443.1 ABC transporter permease subunit [Sulfitobacter sp.]